MKVLSEIYPSAEFVAGAVSLAHQKLVCCYGNPSTLPASSPAGRRRSGGVIAERTSSGRRAKTPPRKCGPCTAPSLQLQNVLCPHGHPSRKQNKVFIPTEAPRASETMDHRLIGLKSRMCCLAVVDVRSPKSRCRQSHAPSAGSGEGPSLPISASGGFESLLIVAGR